MSTTGFARIIWPTWGRLSHFIQGLEDEIVSDAKTGRVYMKTVNETRQCHKCGQVGHIVRYCRNKATTQDPENKKALGKFEN